MEGNRDRAGLVVLGGTVTTELAAEGTERCCAVSGVTVSGAVFTQVFRNFETG
jgi:hypothetical protein